MTGNSDTEQWIEAFRKNRYRYEKFERMLINLLEIFIKNNGLHAQISSRTKSIESFKEKVERKRKEGKIYDNPLNQITDLVGIRIITYYLKDIDTINDLIKREFEIDNTNSVDKSALLGIDQFGYKSVHYIISLSLERRDLLEWAEFKEFKAEIQVRTILQHAWAEIDHEIRYKNEENIPAEIKRRIYRLMALIELADEEFQNLKNNTEEIKDRYLKDITFGNLKIKVDVISLSAYFSFTKQEEKWMNISNDIIVDILKSYKTEKNVSANIKIMKEFFNYTNITNLVKILDRLGINNLKEFDNILQEANRWGKEALKLTWKSWLDTEIDLTQDGVYSYWFDPYFNISILILHSKESFVRANPALLDGIDYLWMIKGAWKI